MSHSKLFASVCLWFAALCSAPGAGAQSLTPDRASADVHIVVYSSYACSYCATWAEALESLMKTHEGNLSVQVQPFPLDAQRERWSIAAAQALAAQGQLRALHRSLFDRLAGRIDPETWRTRAQDAGIDLKRLDEDIETALAASMETGELARAHGVRVTPTIFVDGLRFEGLPSIESIDTVIRARLVQASSGATQTNAALGATR